MIGLSLALSGCATYSTDECSSGDWNKIGVQDGTDGRKQDRFKQHARACKLDSSEASRAIYNAGRQRGLAIYCTTVRGYREGALGQKYYGVCPPAAAKLFFTGYQLGSRINQLEDKISDVNDAYHVVNQKLQGKPLPDEEWGRLMQEQTRLNGDQTRLDAELKQLRDEADAMVREARREKKQ